MTMHVIDYEIIGDDLQFVEVELDLGEAAVGEAGAMMYMQDGVSMDTVFGDGSAQEGGWMASCLAPASACSPANRCSPPCLSTKARAKRVAFAAASPGKIVLVHLRELGGAAAGAKDALRCAARACRWASPSALAGRRPVWRRGLYPAKLEGDGYVFLHAGGALVEKQLKAGEVLRVDTGCVVAFQPSVDFDIEYVGKPKSALFGGEGLFFATLTGLGHVWLQSLPFSRLADRI